MMAPPRFRTRCRRSGNSVASSGASSHYGVPEQRRSANVCSVRISTALLWPLRLLATQARASWCIASTVWRLTQVGRVSVLQSR